MYPVISNEEIALEKGFVTLPLQRLLERPQALCAMGRVSMPEQDAQARTARSIDANLKTRAPKGKA